MSSSLREGRHASLKETAANARQQAREAVAGREVALAELKKMRRERSAANSQKDVKLASALRQRAALEREVEALRTRLRAGAGTSPRSSPRAKIPGPTPIARRTRAAILAAKATASLRRGGGWK